MRTFYRQPNDPVLSAFCLIFFFAIYPDVAHELKFRDRQRGKKIKELFRQQYYRTCDRNHPKLPISQLPHLCRSESLQKLIHRSLQIVFTPITRKHTGLYYFHTVQSFYFFNSCTVVAIQSPRLGGRHTHFIRYPVPLGQLNLQEFSPKWPFTTKQPGDRLRQQMWSILYTPHPAVCC